MEGKLRSLTDVHDIIAAAGDGRRFSKHGEAPRKQFVFLGGEPLFLHSLRCFLASPLIDRIVLAVPADAVESSTELVKLEFGSGEVEVIAGGAERQESVYSAFKAIRESVEVVGVHDAARPVLW